MSMAGSGDEHGEAKVEGERAGSAATGHGEAEVTEVTEGVAAGAGSSGAAAAPVAHRVDRLEGIMSQLAESNLMLGKKVDALSAMLMESQKAGGVEDAKGDEDGVGHAHDGGEDDATEEGEWETFARRARRNRKSLGRAEKKVVAKEEKHSSKLIQEYDKLMLVTLGSTIKAKWKFAGRNPGSQSTVAYIGRMKKEIERELAQILLNVESDHDQNQVCQRVINSLCRHWEGPAKEMVQHQLNGWKSDDYKALLDNVWVMVDREFGQPDQAALSMCELQKTREPSMHLRAFVDEFQQRVTAFKEVCEGLEDMASMPTEELLATMFRAQCNSRSLSRAILDAQRSRKGPSIMGWSALSNAIKYEATFSKFLAGGPDDIAAVAPGTDTWLEASAPRRGRSTSPKAHAGVAGGQAAGLKNVLGGGKGGAGGPPRPRSPTPPRAPSAPPGTYETSRGQSKECFKCGGNHFRYWCPKESVEDRKAMVLDRLKRRHKVVPQAVLDLRLTEAELESNELLRAAHDEALAWEKKRMLDGPHAMPVVVAKVGSASVVNDNMEEMAAFKQVDVKEHVLIERQMHIAVDVEGVVACAVVDSGAELNLIPAGTAAAIMELSGLREWSGSDIQTLNGIGDAMVPVGGSVTLPVKINGVLTDIQLVVVPQIGGNAKAPLLLGIPALKAAGISVDFASRTATVKGAAAELSLAYDVRQCMVSQGMELVVDGDGRVMPWAISKRA